MHASLEGSRLGSQALQAHRRRAIGDAHKVELDEARVVEPSPHPRGDVGVEPTARPDDRRAGSTELGQVVDRAAYVVVGDVAENTAHEHDLCGHGVLVHIGPACIAAHDFDALEIEALRLSPRALNQRGLELNEARANIAVPRMLSEHPEDVTAVAGAHADGADLSGRRAVERGANRPPHHLQAPHQRRVRRVLIVPGHPVSRHNSSLVEVVDRIAIVTGGASGIGAALARRFAADGAAAVVIADVDAAAAEVVAAEIGGTAVMADVSVEADVRALVQRVLEQHGRVDIYCSNAGIGLGGGQDAPDDSWQRSWEVNVMAHVYAARALVPGWLARGDGYFLGTISAAALLNHVLAAPYAATKAAALSFFEWLAITYGPLGLRVAALCPQGVRTPMLLRSQEVSDFLLAGALEPEQVADIVVTAMRDERFLILPHPEVGEYFARKGADYDRWISGMQRLSQRVSGS